MLSFKDDCENENNNDYYGYYGDGGGGIDLMHSLAFADRSRTLAVALNKTLQKSEDESDFRS